MKDLLAHLDRWRKENAEIALATVVRARGSVPRPPGARMCVTRDGRMVGSVSGGCVEGDVVTRAQGVLQNMRPEIASYGIADELELRVGLSCGGEIDVLVQPFPETEAWEAWCHALERDRPAALALVLAPESLLGRDLCVGEDGTVTGTIASGVSEAVVEEARRSLEFGRTAVVEIPCVEGKAEVFIEVFRPGPRLLIVGATDAGVHLCRMAKEVGFRVVVIDPRSVFATRERFPEADEILVSWPGEAMEKAGLDERTCVVTLTHDPKFDIPTLIRALRAPLPYIGAIGSRKTHARRTERLREDGFTEEELRRIHAPIGLDLGGRMPGETALSILAEVVAVLHGRSGGSLRERRKGIHED